jgi:anti-sigma-K factor RskA
VNVKEYISSGIIESYVLGLSSAEEAEELERMCAAHSEVYQARSIFEEQLERNAILLGVQPPKKLKTLILSEIEIDAELLASKRMPAVTEEKKTPLIFNFTPRLWKRMAAAAVVLLATSTILNFYFYYQYDKYNREYSNLLSAKKQQDTEHEQMQKAMQGYATTVNVMADTNMAVINLHGMHNHPEYSASVYWNKKSKDVYLMAKDLPPPPQGRAYQLWAMTDGTPVDAGVLDWNNKNWLTPMNKVSAAQSFAITLEKEGGSDSPTAGSMYLVSNP